MSSKTNVAVITEILETHEGRDKFLKTLSYAAKFATLFSGSSENLKKFRHFGNKMSECRVVLRLMDDVSILREAIGYGLGKQEPDRYTRLLKLLSNVVDVIASPIEHICWAGEQKLVATNESFWDNLSTRLWVISLCLSLLISVKRLDRIDSDMRHESDKYIRVSCEHRSNEEIEIIYKKRKNQMLTCVRLSLDLSYAISYLPSDDLWGYRLKTWQVGLLGTLSSVIGIYQIFKKYSSRPITS